MKRRTNNFHIVAVDEKTGKVNEKMLLNPQRLNRYAYGLNNPYRYVDSDGRTAWDIADIVFFAYSAYKFIKEPSWKNAGDLGLDAIGLLPGIPSVGSIKIVGKGLSKVDEVSKVEKKGTRGLGNISGGKATVEQALRAAEKWLGEGYKEIAPGVYRSADGTRQFRMVDPADLSPRHGPSHVHFEAINPKTGKVIENAPIEIIKKD